MHPVYRVGQFFFRKIVFLLDASLVGIALQADAMARGSTVRVLERICIEDGMATDVTLRRHENITI